MDAVQFEFDKSVGRKLVNTGSVTCKHSSQQRVGHFRTTCVEVWAAGLLGCKSTQLSSLLWPHQLGAVIFFSWWTHCSRQAAGRLGIQPVTAEARKCTWSKCWPQTLDQYKQMWPAPCLCAALSQEWYIHFKMVTYLEFFCPLVCTAWGILPYRNLFAISTLEDDSLTT